MRLVERTLQTVSVSLVLAFAVPWPALGQESDTTPVRQSAPSKVERSPSMDQSAREKKQQQIFAATKDKGNPGPIPCDSKNNPKCKPESPSKYHRSVNFDHLENF